MVVFYLSDIFQTMMWQIRGKEEGMSVIIQLEKIRLLTQLYWIAQDDYHNWLPQKICSVWLS